MHVNKRRNVRIISGTSRGSKIHFPDLPGLRPSGDRIRETLFSWLQPSIAGYRCLDMFAGSGALGFEAVSRGAAHVIMIEKNQTACAALQDNASRLRFDKIDIIAADVLNQTLYNQRLDRHQFNLVFIDPPFADNLHAQAIECVIDNGLLLPDGLVYLETGKRSQAASVPANWQLHREKVAGEVRMQLYRMIAGS